MWRSELQIYNAAHVLTARLEHLAFIHDALVCSVSQIILCMCRPERIQGGQFSVPVHLDRLFDIRVA